MNIMEPLMIQPQAHRPRKNGHANHDKRHGHAVCANGEKCVHFPQLSQAAKLSRGNRDPLCFGCQESNADDILAGTQIKTRKGGITLRNLRRIKKERGTTYGRISAECYRLGADMGVSLLSNLACLRCQATKDQASTIAFILDASVAQLEGEPSKVEEVSDVESK